MNLKAIIDAARPIEATGVVDMTIPIESIHYRAQDVSRHGLFVAVPGFAADGHDFVDKALANGAAAVVAQKPLTVDVPVLRVDDSRAALAKIATAFYGHPSRRMTVVGITGTNGKTTVSYILESILEAAGVTAGILGTVNHRCGGQVWPSANTTPESLDLQRLLAQMRTAGATHAVMEVASHGLTLRRVDGCAFDVGVYTNLTQDHLDFHGDMDRYWQSKKRLFTELLPTGGKAARAVINRDNAHGRELAREMAAVCPLLTFGFDHGNDIWPSVDRSDLNGSRGVIHTPEGDLPFNSPMVGRHNIENLLAAAGAALALGLPREAIQAGLATAAGAPGRLERVPDAHGRFVYVDYAHTPDALENVLNALQALRTHRLICLFGCGGDRDRRKRPLMGAIAGRLSDLVVVTSDNPRTEDPDQIIADILPGITPVMPQSYRAVELQSGWSAPGYIVLPDRREAIALAIGLARPGDTVLIAGKGHENYQIIGRETVPFDDSAVAAEHLEAAPAPAAAAKQAGGDAF
ncbi:MAG: UDP-N-acetylmuramoyl-L-alanyl-D-glutamate--2,6-diaminopimelate ligase [Desulfobacterales bacterium]|nr:UDP-N-acetylmuramoyl-L-alanyl-D-glutamate--2,6-diaminopimelate ligase [Desulfobacterales bacterium]